ncbi:MAG: AraC family transcriptional regulator, partial [Puia sp.]|nr:AraC family transcriptional regulator [Puia sp.]
MYKSPLPLQLTLLNTDRVTLDNQWNYDDVLSPFSRLYLILSGDAKVYHHEETFHLRAGRLYLIPSFTYSRYRCERSMAQYYVHFLEEVGAGLSVYNLKNFIYEREASSRDFGLFERLLALNPDRRLERDDPKIYDNRSSLHHFEALNDRLSAADLVETQGILLMLFAPFMEGPGSIPRASGQKAGKIIDALYFIGEHIQEELTVKALAGRAHLHADYFSRLFYEQTGVRPLEYIQQKRIERAQLLLATTGHSLQEIANRVGLPNISYFSRLFTRTT